MEEKPPFEPGTEAVTAAGSPVAHAPFQLQVESVSRTLSPGETIGPYRLLGVIGEGGFGVVYRAEQDRPRRTVALKLVRVGLASERDLKRFELEAEVLGRLQHPGIAQVYNAGTVPTPTGPQPYFAMEFVDGVPLTEYATRAGLGTRERLALVARIADAVQHAHGKGVIHRDLKPGNILVTADGTPKVLDFGVARLTDRDLQTATMRTDIGVVVGTVPYMSPEQAAGDPTDLDTRSDVYALGVIAYELLVGRLPHDLARKMVHEALRIIREEEPTRLSSINRTLRGDVETIVAKALEKDKPRRYQTASDLAADIRRHLSDEPIAARPASAGYQLRKFARRNRALVAGALVAVLLLVGGVVGTSLALGRALRAEDGLTLQLARTQEARDEAETQRTAAQSAASAAMREMRIARAVTEFLTDDVLASAAPAASGTFGRGKDVTVREALDAAAGRIESASAAGGRFEGEPGVERAVRGAIGQAYAALGELDPALVHLRRAEELAVADTGPDSAEKIETTARLGRLLHQRSEMPEAVRTLRAALERSERLSGPNDPRTIRTLTALGDALRNAGAFEESERTLRDAIERASRASPPDEQLSTVARSGLANLLMQTRSRLPEAETLYREATDRMRAMNGDDDPETLVAINDLALFLNGTGRAAEAEPLLREVLDARRKVLGEDHPDTIVSVMSIAFVLDDLGRYEEALAMHRAALDASGRAVGEDHANTIAAKNNLGAALFASGDIDGATTLMMEALDSIVRMQGPDHPDALSSRNNVGVVLDQQGKSNEALPFMLDALEGRRRTLGPEHPSTIQSMVNVTETYRKIGRFELAEPIAVELLETRRKVLGPDHPDVFTALTNLARTRVELGRYDEAERDVRESMALVDRIYTEPHARRVNSRLFLTAVLRGPRPEPAQDAAADPGAPAPPPPPLPEAHAAEIVRLFEEAREIALALEGPDGMLTARVAELRRQVIGE